MDVCGFPVPAGAQGVGDDVLDLRKDLLYDGPLGADADPLPQLRGHVDQHTLTVPPGDLLLGPPALQLRLQRSQLEEGGLLVQQGVLLYPKPRAQSS